MFAHSLLLVLALAFANSGQARNVFVDEAENATILKTAANAPVGRAESTKQQRGKARKNIFEYGVASGDPLATSVIIWTAVNEPAAALQVQLKWEMSTNAGFNPIVASGTVNALLAYDFTAKVDVTGLSAGTEYWYRFKLGTDSSMTSPVGRTRTLPENGVDEVKLAVFSCTNYPAGYFHAYEDAVRRGAEFALHLGDYIYEYGADGFASGNSEAMGRKSNPLHDLVTLNDYRQRHAQYKSDPDAQLMHANMPMIAVWDDHETANDSYLHGAQNHDESYQGTWSARLSAAIKAYHEWMPIRTGSSMMEIYRSFDFGDLMSIHMLDTRIIGRDRQAAQFDVDFMDDLYSEDRQLLGPEQESWLDERFQNSPGKWQILGQQIVMARMEVPASILKYLEAEGVDPANIAPMFAAITAYITAKGKQNAGIPLTQSEADLLDVILNPKYGYNLDAWDGYPRARERVLNAADAAFNGQDKKLVVLAGDSHSSWYADVTAAGHYEGDGGLSAGTVVAQQIAVAGVTSPGFDLWLASLPPPQVAGLFKSMIDDIEWVDTSKRGYALLTITPAEVKADWIFVTDVTKKTYTSAIGYTAKVPFDS